MNYLRISLNEVIVKFTNQFKLDFKKAEKQHRNIEILKNVVSLLADGMPLPQKYCDHALTGDYKGKRECHLAPDWLLIYKVYSGRLVLGLIRTGSHSDLF